MTPSQVQHAKDGRWYPWVGGSVDGDLLALKKGSGPSAYVNGVVVYALKFPGDRQWSVAGGWKK